MKITYRLGYVVEGPADYFLAAYLSFPLGKGGQCLVEKFSYSKSVLCFVEFVMPCSIRILKVLLEYNN
jgi:hypothetical protein